MTKEFLKPNLLCCVVTLKSDMINLEQHLGPQKSGIANADRKKRPTNTKIHIRLLQVPKRPISSFDNKER